MSAAPAGTETLAAANPDRHFLRKRLRGIALLYAVGVVLALGIGPSMAGVGNLLGRVRLRPHYAPGMYPLLERCDDRSAWGEGSDQDEGFEDEGGDEPAPPKAVDPAVLDALASRFPEGVVNLLLQATRDGLLDHPGSLMFLGAEDFQLAPADRELTISGVTLRALAARVDPGKAVTPIRAALRVGTVPQRTLALDLLERHLGPAAVPLLREARDDADPALAARARTLLAAARASR